MILWTVAGRTGVRLPVNRSFERELAMLEEMSGSTLDEGGVDRLRKSLASRNNYLVAKAARIVTDRNLGNLLPDVLASYDRFFVDPIKNDPQCWAKNALVKALVKLGCDDLRVYLRGLRHRQEEPVWGGHSDTAGTLRANCTQALVSCPGLSEFELLNILLEPLVDLDKTVRLEAAQAIGRVGGTTSLLMLKMRVLLRKEEPEVLGACFTSMLSIDKQKSIPVVANFLEEGEESAAEAAYCLAETHDPMALALLMVRRRDRPDAWFSSVLDHAIALTRLPAGVNFLLGMIEQDTRHAASALEAISRVYNSTEVVEQVAAAVARSSNELVQTAFRQSFVKAKG